METTNDKVHDRKKKINQRNATFFKGLKIFTIIVIIVAIVGFIAQVTLITKDYLRKDVVTEVKIQLPTNMTLPDISFCDRLPNLINFTALKSSYPDFINHLQEKFPFLNSATNYSLYIQNRGNYFAIFLELTKTFSLDQLEELTYDHTDIFYAVNILKNGGRFGFLDDDEFNERCEWKTFFQEQDYCYRLSCSKKSPLVFTEADLMSGLVKGEVVVFRIHERVFTLIDHFYIYVHSANSFPRGLRNPSILVRSYKRSQVTFFTYKRFQATRMPPPFKTNCNVYLRDGRKSSRLEEIERCQNMVSIKAVNAPFYGSIHFAVKNASHGYLPYFVHYNSNETNEVFDKVFSVCNEHVTQPDCLEEYFIPTETLPRKWQNNFTSIILTKPSEPEIIHIAGERLTFAQYIILIESLMNSYFGFTVAFTLPQFIRWLYIRSTKVRSVTQKFRSSISSRKSAIM